MEKFFLKVAAFIVLVALVSAILGGLGGCGTIYGFGTDLRGASKGLSQSTTEMVDKDNR